MFKGCLVLLVAIILVSMFNRSGMVRSTVVLKSS